MGKTGSFEGYKSFPSRVRRGRRGGRTDGQDDDNAYSMSIPLYPT
jgi:hypothetical protein